MMKITAHRFNWIGMNQKIIEMSVERQHKYHVIIMTAKGSIRAIIYFSGLI